MKKGFTLIEIIISISLVLIISLSALFNFNFLKKKELTNELNNRNNDILNAATVFIETNNEITQ